MWPALLLGSQGRYASGQSSSSVFEFSSVCFFKKLTGATFLSVGFILPYFMSNLLEWPIMFYFHLSTGGLEYLVLSDSVIVFCVHHIQIISHL